MQNALEIKRFDLNELEVYNKSQDSIDMSLSSDEGLSQAVDWIAFKSSDSKSLLGSAMMSTLQQSERRISVYSKQGSMVDTCAMSLIKE